MLYPVMAALLPRSDIVAAMARPLDASTAETNAYHGEVWTDARGYATVSLPAEAGPLEPPVEYELQDLEPPSTARVTGELKRPMRRVRQSTGRGGQMFSKGFAI